MSARCDGLVRTIDRLARAQGWRIEHRPGGHLRYVPPDPTKPAVIAASTPGGGRWIRNMVAQLKRSGLDLRARDRRRRHHDEAQTHSAVTKEDTMSSSSDRTREPQLSPPSSPPQQEPVPRPPGASRTFAATLREARTSRNNTEAEVALVLETTTAVVRSWEEEGVAPVGRHYEGLVRLYPELAGVERPKRQRAQPAPPMPESSGSGSIAQSLRLLRDVRRVREVLLPILQAAAEARLGIADLLELVR